MVSKDLVEYVVCGIRVTFIDGQHRIRIAGRRFMLSISLLMFLLGFEALAFSRLEGWSFVRQNPRVQTSADCLSSARWDLLFSCL